VLRRRQRQLKNALAEAAQFQRRALLGALLVALGIVILGSRYFYLQIVQHEALSARADQNRIKLRPLVPARGRIYDRNGMLLADNVPAYRLELVPEQVRDIDATLAGLGAILPLDEDEIARFHDLRRSRRGFHPIPLKLRLSEAEVAAFAVDRHRFPGVDVAPYLTRRYLRGAEFAHVIGYVGRIDRDDAAGLDAERYAGATHIGKAGIERYYESRLHGEVGFEQVEVNAEGRVLRVLRAQPAESGENLYLSIDAELQAATVAAFDGQHGAAVAIDPRSGEVLALVSLPSYDPNLFVNGISRSDYALLQGPSRPLFNRALLGGYEPGSTLKPFVGLAALEVGVMRAEQRILSTGAFRLPGQEREYRDWRRGGHGLVDLREALAQSVNTYFFQAAVDLGIDRLGDQLARFGFGSPTGIDLIGEAAGILPTRAWKRATRQQPWYLGETVIAGIGQGFWVTTPLQLARATAALADAGRLRQPRLLSRTQQGLAAAPRPEPHPPPRDLELTATHLQAVVEGMVAAMHAATGTAREAAQGAPYRIAGKTGTAQRVSRRTEEAINLEDLPFHLRHRALFIGFAPAESPSIALALVVESGGSGARAAAPIGRSILDAWLLRGAAP
jgi:penicillin-binding protein 2